MGEISEMMLDGTLCEGCGVYMGDACDFPRRCRYCAVEHKAARKADNIARNVAQHAAAKKIPCTVCAKRVSTVGMNDHIKDVHGLKAGGDYE